MKRLTISLVTTVILAFLTVTSVGLSIFVYLEALSVEERQTQSDIFINISQYQHEIFQTRNILAQLVFNPTQDMTRKEFDKWFDIVWSRTETLDQGIIGKELIYYGLKVESVSKRINKIDTILQSSKNLPREDLLMIQGIFNEIISETQSFIITAQAKRELREDEERAILYHSLELVVFLNFLTFIFGTLTIFIIYRKNTQLTKLHETLETRVHERTIELEEKQTKLSAENEERKRIETQLRESQQITENASRSKTQFLANMSHELRTPLNAIIGFADVMHLELLGPIENPKYKSYLLDIVTSGRHLSALLKNILDLSKIEAQEMEIKPEAINLATTIQDSIVLLKPNLHTKQHKLETNFLDDVIVSFDPTHLQQILLNLISNAIKYTPSKGKISISIIDTPEGDIKVEVKDNGPGIPSEKLNDILKPFHRLNDSATANESGTGIGLSISQQLAKLHDCRLVIESEDRKGTNSCLLIIKERIVK